MNNNRHSSGQSGFMHNYAQTNYGPRTTVPGQHIPEEFNIGKCIDGELLYCSPKYKKYILSKLPEILKKIEEAGFGEYRPVMISTVGGISINENTNMMYDTFTLDLKKELEQFMQNSYDIELQDIYSKFITSLSDQTINKIFEEGIVNDPSIPMKIEFVESDNNKIGEDKIEEFKDKELIFLSCTISKNEDSNILTIVVKDKAKENLIKEDNSNELEL